MKNKKRKIIIGIIIGAVLGLVGFLYAAQYYRVNAGEQAHVNEHDVCKVVVNPSGYSDIFVPTNTSGEWEKFRNNKPGHIELWDCVYGLFLTGSTYNGNLGGRSGADAKCNAAKPSRCVDNKPAWAFISVNADDEIRDMPSTKGLDTGRSWWWTKDNTMKKAASNWGDLLDGSIENSAKDAGYPDVYYWTGSFADGSWDEWGDACKGWTRSTPAPGMIYPPFGRLGRSFYKGSYWLTHSRERCNNDFYLLCACDAY